jgi:hypothetical protein
MKKRVAKFFLAEKELVGSGTPEDFIFHSPDQSKRMIKLAGKVRDKCRELGRRQKLVHNFSP